MEVSIMNSRKISMTLPHLKVVR